MERGKEMELADLPVHGFISLTEVEVNGKEEGWDFFENPFQPKRKPGAFPLRCIQRGACMALILRFLQETSC